MTAATAPFCSWLIAACLSRTVVGISGADANADKLGSGRRRSRRLSQSTVCAQATGAMGSVVALCESGLLGLGSCLSFEACPEYQSAKWSPFFGPPLPQKPTRRNLRPRSRAAAGKAAAIVGVQPIKDCPDDRKRISSRKRRVVVTGMGLVSCLGHDPDTFYQNLLQGRSGISNIESFDCKDFPTRIAGEIKTFSTEGYVAPKFSKRMDKFMLYLLTAGKKAVLDAGITREVMEELDKSKCGVLIGSALGGIQVFNDAIEALRVSHRKMNPFCVPFATTNMGSAMLAMDLGWMGPNYSISTACATSNFCMLNAANHVLRGEADIMLAGGSDAAVIPIGLGGFVACRALSQRNDDPAKASRPWDQDRDGFVLGEGAGALVLEELEHAKMRGANIYAEFLGGSSTCDAYHMTEPHPEGAGVLLCIQKALAESGVTSQDVNYVNAHATSTKAGDIQEYKAVMRCFGQNPELKLNSTKSMTGHLLGAAGAVEAIATVQVSHAILVFLASLPDSRPSAPDGFIPPSTLTILKREWYCVLLLYRAFAKDVFAEQNMDVVVGNEKQRLDIKVALSNSFGFGGHNSCVLFAPYREIAEN